MAVSCAFDNEGIGEPYSNGVVFALTPRVFEKEAEDKRAQEGQQKNSIRASENFTHEDSLERTSQISVRAATGQRKSGHGSPKTCAAHLAEPCKDPAKEIVVAYWDPDVYRSKRLWPVVCLFGASFGVLHLLSWNAVFPTLVELWLWRAAALVSIFSMLVFMQFEKVVFRWGGPLTIISLVSPVLYFLSRIVMMGGVIAAFRASDPAIYDTYPASTYWVHIL